MRSTRVRVCISALAVTAALAIEPATARTLTITAASAASAVSAVPQAALEPSITAPGKADLGTATPGTSVSVNLGSVTVTNVGLTGWTAAVSATPLRTGSGTAAETIPISGISYWSGPIVNQIGVGTWTPGQPTVADAQALSSPRTAFSYTGTVATSIVTWDPTLVVSVPRTAVAGSYEGTVTHSVA